YAVGVLLYELLTGSLPVRAGTPARWRHAHLTQAPAPPAELVAHLAPVLNEIVLLLLAKSPDDRYHTARGLAADLERGGSPQAGTPLLLRTKDVPDRLLPGGRVYGRESRSNRLQAAYDRVAAGGPAELVTVTGDGGLGKWAMVTEFADAVVRTGGCTLRTACTREDRDAGRGPYPAVAGLLADLAGQLADAPAARRERIVHAVGGCGATLAELVPALRSMLGAGPRPEPWGARHRLHLGARRLFGAVG